MRNRVSDSLNEAQRLVISLTDVVIDDRERLNFVALNMNLMKSIVQR